MENSAPIRNPFFVTQLHIASSQCKCGKTMGEANLNSIQKYFGGTDCFFFHAYPCIAIIKSSVRAQLVSARRL